MNDIPKLLTSLDWKVQPPYLHPDYKSTILRAPQQPLIPMPNTLSELTAPVYGHEDIRPLDNDLTKNAVVNGQPLGERIIVVGRVVDEDGRPVPNALLEIWQADSQGYYHHPDDPNAAQADPNFRYFGRADTINNGIYTFRTVKPGKVLFDADHEQAPHINVRLFSRGLLIHAYTRLYFADEAEANQNDPVLNLVPDIRRHTLITLPQDTGDLTTYCFNIALQGENETVFFNP